MTNTTSAPGAELATTDTPGPGELAVQIQGRGTLIVPEALIEQFPALNPDLDIADLLEGALGPGGELRLSDLTKIKVPAAEITRLQVPDADGEFNGVSQFNVIPVAMTSRRSFWSDPNPSGKPPECTSRDLVHGEGVFGPGSQDNPDGTCDSCPMSQMGSIAQIDSKREGSNGSACKEQRLLFGLSDVELLPLMIVVPPGSLQAHKKFGIGLAKRGILGPPRPEQGTTPSGRPVRAASWLAVEIGLSLEQATSGTGQAYNKLVFKQVRKLSPTEAEVISVYGMYVDELIAKQAESLDKVAADAAADPSGTSEAGAAGPGGVEFDAEGMPMDEVDLSGVGGKGARGTGG